MADEELDDELEEEFSGEDQYEEEDDTVCDIFFSSTCTDFCDCLRSFAHFCFCRIRWGLL